MEQKVHCPICNGIIKHYNPRYPNGVCNSCGSKATDEFGRKLVFYNVSLSGGYRAQFANNDEEYDSHACYIDGIECYANEAKFGGIVIEIRAEE